MPMFRLVAVAALMLFAACGSSTDYSSSPPPPPPPPGPPPPPPAPPAATITVSDNSFSPTPDTISSGQSVAFTWGTATTHNVTFEDGQQNSGNKGSGSHTRTFPTVTTNTSFRYECTLHGSGFTTGMVGVIVVKP
jgi:plastocyanin